MSSRTNHSGVQITIFLCLLSVTGYAATVTDSVFLYTPFTKISVPPGQSVDYSIDLINKSRGVVNADISIRGLPSSWNYTVKAGTYNIREVSVLSGDRKSMNLSIVVPLKVNKGSYPFRIVAGNIYELPLTIIVSEKGTFKTEFTTNQANMVGNTNSTFTYQAMLRNSTGEKQLYALMADAPPGWKVDFKYNSRQVTSVEVNENSNASMTVEIDPPDMIEAGTYKIPVRASTNSTSAELVLEAVIAGSFGMELTTPTGLLSTEITANDQKRIELVLKNTGSAPLRGIQLSASAPINWEVVFDPKKIEVVEPGKTAQAFAIVKAAKKAIPGDYVTSIDAKTPQVTSRAQFRISVRTSLIWGWVGILIISGALGSVYYLFRQYGRR
jgi:uncharacterized membrane protein